MVFNWKERGNATGIIVIIIIIILAILPLALVSKLDCLWHREEAVYLGHCLAPEVNQLPPDCSPTLHRNPLKILGRGRPRTTRAGFRKRCRPTLGFSIIKPKVGTTLDWHLCGQQNVSRSSDCTPPRVTEDTSRTSQG